tara:strand:+ start:1234 stop:1527 length:294 start_codon:yes stop_codon:yes gene_type:complete
MKKDIFDSYAKSLAEKFGITLAEMFTKNNRQDIVDARYMLYFLCIERLIKISYIQKFMLDSGLKVGHSTVRHGYKKAKKAISADSDYKQLINDIIKD